MNNLSSSCLFHFTELLNNLFGILENGFHPNLCGESLEPIYPKGAIPMVCFCDIPLTMITKHTETYGHFGIGLKKEWGLKQKLNPVHYCTNSSQHLFSVDQRISEGNIITSYASKIKDNDNINNHIKAFDYYTYYDISFLKQYESIDKKGNKKIFYDEKEWRYVVPDFEYEGENYSSDYKEFIQRPDFVLKFTINDIDHIILKTDEHILPFIYKLNEIDSKLLSSDDKEILKTRIITIEKIIKDF